MILNANPKAQYLSYQHEINLAINDFIKGKVVRPLIKFN